MTDKVQKIREGVERLKSQLLRGACSSQIAMETMCKEEAYNEVLAILDTMQEETKQCMYSKDNYTEEDRKVLCEGCEEKCKFNQVKESAILQHKEEMCKENGDSLTQEPVSEDLGDYVNELSKQFPEVSFAKLSRIAVRVAKWQKEKEYTCYEEAFEDGAKWQGEKDNEEKVLTYKHGFNDCKEQMMAKAVDGEVTYGKSLAIPSLGWVLDKEELNFGDKVKLIIIKQE